jgi:hypothetical protein
LHSWTYLSLLIDGCTWCATYLLKLPPLCLMEEIRLILHLRRWYQVWGLRLGRTSSVRHLIHSHRADEVRSVRGKSSCSSPGAKRDSPPQRVAYLPGAPGVGGGDVYNCSSLTIDGGPPCSPPCSPSC